MFHHIMVPSCIISCHIMSLCLTCYMIHITYHIITLQFIMYHLLLIIHHAPYITYYVSFIMDQFAFIIATCSIAIILFCQVISISTSYHVTYLPELCCIISCHIMSIFYAWVCFSICPSGLWRSFLHGCGGSKLRLAANSLEGDQQEIQPDNSVGSQQSFLSASGILWGFGQSTLDFLGAW